MFALRFCLELRIMAGKLQFPSEQQHKCILQSRSNTDNGWRKIERKWKRLGKTRQYSQSNNIYDMFLLV